MRLHYWLEAFEMYKGRFRRTRIISRFEARLSTTPLTVKVVDGDWPGEQVGTAELHVTDGSDTPEAVHVLAHYHDNYFDCILLFTDLKQAKAKFGELQRREWEDVEQSVYQHYERGVVKMSKYHCALVELEDGVFQNPDKGSTLMLLPYVPVEQ